MKNEFFIMFILFIEIYYQLTDKILYLYVDLRMVYKLFYAQSGPCRHGEHRFKITIRR